MLVFAGAAEPADQSEIGALTGLLIGELSKDSVFHSVSWLPHKSKLPVKSMFSAGILASPEGVDEAKTVAYA